MSKQFQIPPNAVRIWRGFRGPNLNLQQFLDRLGKTFIPSTVEMQIHNGLDVYIPTVPAGMDDKPDTVPDETAILFWDSQETYKNGFNTLAGRTYTLTHGGVYTPASGADFPTLYQGALKMNQCYYLIDRSADWMHGKVTHLVAALPDAPTADIFHSYQEILNGIQSRAAVDGAIVCVGSSYIVYWQLNGQNDPGLDELTKATGWHHQFIAKPFTLPESAALWNSWPEGMTVNSGDSFNMQFMRRFEKAKPMPVAPDSVHIWRGFRSSSKTAEAFADFLGQTFVPACSLLQPRVGLRAYLPSLLALENEHGQKPATIPDQTALMFWSEPKAHDEANKTVAVRVYQNIHGDAYDTKKSRSQLPVPLADELAFDQPYYLVDKPADWMLGHVQHLVGARYDEQDPDEFQGFVYKWAAHVRDNPPAGLEGALVCLNEGYVVVWLLWVAETAVVSDLLDHLAEQLIPWLNTIAEQYELPAGLWDDWPGIKMEYPNLLNIQLNRPESDDAAAYSQL